MDIFRAQSFTSNHAQHQEQTMLDKLFDRVIGVVEDSVTEPPELLYDHENSLVADDALKLLKNMEV
jgi:hypothetical protein